MAKKTAKMKIERAFEYDTGYRFHALLGNRWMYHKGTRKTKGWARRIGNDWAKRANLTPVWE